MAISICRGYWPAPRERSRSLPRSRSRTHPLPKHVGTVLFFFDLLENAAQAVDEIMPSRPTACDLMDRRHLSLARETDPRYAALIPAEAEAVLLVEFDGARRTRIARTDAAIDRSSA